MQMARTAVAARTSRRARGPGCWSAACSPSRSSPASATHGAILRQADFFAPANPAIAFFYLLTAVHGLHLLGGLFVWGRTLSRMRSKDVELIDVRLSVELCSVYWHYLLLVWLGAVRVSAA